MIERILFSGQLLSGILIVSAQDKDTIFIATKEIASKVLQEGTPVPCLF